MEIMKVKDLIDMLGGFSPEADVRRGAAEGLVKLREPRTLPELVAALEDPDVKVRSYAIAAIHNRIVRRYEFDPKQPPGT